MLSSHFISQILPIKKFCRFTLLKGVFKGMRQGFSGGRVRRGFSCHPFLLGYIGNTLLIIIRGFPDDGDSKCPISNWIGPEGRQLFMCAFTSVHSVMINEESRCIAMHW